MNEIPFKDQLKIWSYVALHSFGGPAAQIALIHKVVVEEKKIISEERFLHSLNFCMLLPGPEAQQLATYVGWLMGKWRGGLLAGMLFILPGFLSILFLSYLYIFFYKFSFVEGLFYGLKSSVVVIVLLALYRISNKSLTTSFARMLSIGAFISLFLFKISFPIVIIFSALLGMIFGKFFFTPESTSFFDSFQLPKLKSTLITALTWILVWFLPVLFIFFIFGKDSTFHQLNLFFSKMSMVTFGGAYAALSYVAEKAVEVYGWLTPSEMIDGLAMAETTPGPLIQSVQFVGFMGGYRFPDLSSPAFSAFIASLLTTWMTFAPCFLWIFTFAPYVEYLRTQQLLSNALKAITASVVGVIFNLSVWFIFKTLFAQTTQIKNSILNFEYPNLGSIDFYALAIVGIAIFLQLKMKSKLITTFIVCGICGMLKILVLE